MDEIMRDSNLGSSLNRHFLPGQTSSVEVKSTTSVRSSRRLRYQAEVQVIRKEIGDLEQVRLRLGLSQRKMGELLMVDPSAWTRWTKLNQAAPPHIYRMLEWYLLVKRDHPGLAHQYYERKPAADLAGDEAAKATDRLCKQVYVLESQLIRWKRITVGIAIILAVGFAVLTLSAIKMSAH